MTDTLPAVRTDPTIRLRRAASVAALPLAFAFQIVANALYAVASADGGTDTGTGEQALDFYAQHGDTLRVTAFLAIIGSLLAVPGVLAAVRVLRPSRPRLALAAGLLMVTGYICYFGVVMGSFTTAALADGGVDAGAALDAASNDPMTMPWFVLFALGNLVGTLLLGLAIVLSPQLPKLAGFLVMGWPVGHVINLIVGNEWFAVAGGVLEVAGLLIIAAVAMRLTADEWAARG